MQQSNYERPNNKDRNEETKLRVSSIYVVQEGTTEELRSSLTSARSIYDSMVNVKVGPQAVQFEVHRGLLCYQSAYFNSCLNSTFKEAREKAVTLDDEDPKIFKRFFAWLYTGKLLYDEETVEKVPYGELLRSYIFAEKRLAPRFQNACIDAVILRDKVFQQLPNTEETQRVWDNVCDSSPMRRLLVDLLVLLGDMPKIIHEDSKIDFSADFLASIIRGLYVLKGSGPLSRQDLDFWGKRCSYHTHEDGSSECV